MRYFNINKIKKGIAIIKQIRYNLNIIIKRRCLNYDEKKYKK